jgi:hypothetical protein
LIFFVENTHQMLAIKLLLVLILLASPLWGADYYMREDGSAGSIAAATGPCSTVGNCMSVATLNAGGTITDGDTVTLCDDGGNITTQINPVGGTSDYVTYKGESGTTVTLDGGAVPTAMFYLTGKDYIEIQDLTITDASNDGIQVREGDNFKFHDLIVHTNGRFGVLVTAADGNITNVNIYDSTIHSNGLISGSSGGVWVQASTDKSVTTGAIYGNTLYGVDETRQKSQILLYPTNGGSVSGFNIYDNTISVIEQDGITIARNVSDVNVYNNSVSDSDSILIHMGGATEATEATYTRNISVYDNNLWLTRVHATDSAGVELDDYSRNCNVYRNKIQQIAEAGIKVNYSSSNQIYNNLIAVSGESGMELRGNTGTSSGPSSNNLVYNNTVVVDGSNAGILVSGNAGDTGANIFKNNILYNSGSTPYGFSVTSDQAQTVDYNVVNGFSTANHSGISAGANSVTTDPNLAADYTLTASSANAIDAGTDLGAPYDIALDANSVWPDQVYTMNQSAWGAGWEIGAFGYGVPDTFDGQTDLCPDTAPADPVDAYGCSDAQVDADGDGVCAPGAPSGGPSGCTGVDWCGEAPPGDFESFQDCRDTLVDENCSVGRRGREASCVQAQLDACAPGCQKDPPPPPRGR